MKPMRLVVTLVLAILLAGPPAGAQPAGKKLARVVLVFTTSPVAEMLGPDPVAPDARVFVHTLRDRGWIDGQTVVIERRSAEAKWDQVPALFTDVVRQEPDVIVAVSTRLARAATQATATIPIVGAPMSMAVENGLAASLARPGANLTGVDVAQTPDLTAKRLQLLKEAVPGVTRVAVLSNSFSFPRLQATQGLVKPMGITLDVFDAESEAKLDAALAAVAGDRPTALVIDEVPFLFEQRRRLVEFAVRHRLPSVANPREFAATGVLVTYGYNVLDMFRDVAGYVDRILRGAKPGDLPIERPARFDFVVNRKTARVLGITLPPSILVQATEVID